MADKLMYIPNNDARNYPSLVVTNDWTLNFMNQLIKFNISTQSCQIIIKLWGLV